MNVAVRRQLARRERLEIPGVAKFAGLELGGARTDPQWSPGKRRQVSTAPRFVFPDVVRRAMQLRALRGPVAGDTWGGVRLQVDFIPEPGCWKLAARQRPQPGATTR